MTDENDKPFDLDWEVAEPLPSEPPAVEPPRADAEGGRPRALYQPPSEEELARLRRRPAAQSDTGPVTSPEVTPGPASPARRPLPPLPKVPPPKGRPLPPPLRTAPTASHGDSMRPTPRHPLSLADGPAAKESIDALFDDMESGFATGTVQKPGTPARPATVPVPAPPSAPAIELFSIDDELERTIAALPQTRATGELPLRSDEVEIRMDSEPLPEREADTPLRPTAKLETQPPSGPSADLTGGTVEAATEAAATLSIPPAAENAVPVPRPPSVRPPSVRPPSVRPPEPRIDRGAATARRTLRSRKPRREAFPLVGDTRAAWMFRAEMLEDAAGRLEGAARISTLLAASELRARAGDVSGARARAFQARDVDRGEPCAATWATSAAVATGERGLIIEALHTEAKARTGREAALRGATAAALTHGEPDAATYATEAFRADPNAASAVVAVRAATDFDVRRAAAERTPELQREAAREFVIAAAVLAGQDIGSQALASELIRAARQRDAAAWRAVGTRLEGSVAEAAFALAVAHGDAPSADAGLVGAVFAMDEAARARAVDEAATIRSVASGSTGAEADALHALAALVGGEPMRGGVEDEGSIATVARAALQRRSGLDPVGDPIDLALARSDGELSALDEWLSENRSDPTLALVRRDAALATDETTSVGIALRGNGSVALPLQDPEAVRLVAMLGEPTERASAWAQEASTDGLDHAFASREAARASHGQDALTAWLDQADTVTGAGEVAVVIAERSGHPALRARVLQRAAARMDDADHRASSLVQAALVAAADDPELARTLMASAAEQLPDDAILALMRLRDSAGEPGSVDLGRPLVEGAGEALRRDVAAHIRAVAGLPAAMEFEGPGVAASYARVEPGAPGPDDIVVTEEQDVFRSADPDAALALAERVGSADRAGMLRVAFASSLARGVDDEFDRRWFAATDGVPLDRWLARRRAACAARFGERGAAEQAALRVADLVHTAAERASLAMHAIPTNGSDSSLEAVRAFHVASPEHHLLTEHLGILEEASGQHQRAASAFESAARRSSESNRRARLFVRAAELADAGGDRLRGIQLLEEASRSSVVYPGLFERLRVALADDPVRLSELMSRRLAAGGDDAGTVQLLVAQAGIKEAAGDRAGAREALRTALELAPEHGDALRRLAQVELADGDARAAAEALVRLARLNRDSNEVRWIFLELASLYEGPIPDAKRAELAYRRVLRLVPEDRVAAERLAELLRRQGQFAPAVEQYEALVRTEPDGARARLLSLQLAQVHEEAGDARKAEFVLEATRRTAPTDLTTADALHAFYKRQGATGALAMHQHRCAQEYRALLERDLTDRAGWEGLLHVLGWRAYRRDPLAVAASTLRGLGIADSSLAGAIESIPEPPGCLDVLSRGELDDVLAPPLLAAGVRFALRQLGTHLDKAVAFDPRSVRAERARDADADRRCSEAGVLLERSDLELWLTPGRAVTPFISNGPAVALGRDLLGLPPKALQFVLLRGWVLGSAGFSGVDRAPAEVTSMLAFVARQFDPALQPIGLDPGHVLEQGRRLARQAPRKTLEEVGPTMCEFIGAPDFAAGALRQACLAFANRFAALAVGEVPAAIHGVLAVRGVSVTESEVASAVVGDAEARSLVEFLLSEACFDARQRSGAVLSPSVGPGR